MDFISVLQNTLPVIAQNAPGWAILIILCGFFFVQMRNGKAKALPVTPEQLNAVAKENRDYYTSALGEVRTGFENVVVAMGKQTAEQTGFLTDSMNRHNEFLLKQNELLDAIKNELLDARRDIKDVSRRLP